MFKRIGGGLLLGAGLLWSVVSLIILAYAIPSQFTLEGEGLLWVALVVEQFSLTDDILRVLTGLAMVLTAIPLLLAPYRRRIRLTAGHTEPEAQPVQLPVGLLDQGEYVIYTRLISMEPEGGRTTEVLSHLKPGEPLTCRPASDQMPELLCVCTRKGRELGYLDTTLVRGLRSRYPHRRIGLSVERISGGGGVPFTCDVRVGVCRE